MVCLDISAASFVMFIYFVSAGAGTELQQSPDLQDFFLQSSDEEDVCSLELSDSQLDLEEHIMAYFDKNPRNNTRPLREKLSKYGTFSCFSIHSFIHQSYQINFQYILKLS